MVWWQGREVSAVPSRWSLFKLSVASALTYGNSGATVAFQQGGGGAGAQGKGRDAATGKWLALAGGNPDNPDACGYIKHTKGHVCWKNHFAK